MILILKICLKRQCLDGNSSSDYEEKGVGFNIYKHLRMTLYSQINPISHLNNDTIASRMYQIHTDLGFLTTAEPRI